MQDAAAHPTKVSSEALDQLFRQARTHNAWLPKRVPLAALREAYDLALGPDQREFLSCAFPIPRERSWPRHGFCRHLALLNVEKTKAAPVTAIIAWQMEFHEKLPKLFPHADMRSYFVGKPALIEESAFRNGSLQGAYFILAARAVGLDCRPMSGFDPAKVNAEFFPDGKWKVNFLCNLGYGDDSKLFPRSPRLEFEEACRVL